MVDELQNNQQKLLKMLDASKTLALATLNAQHEPEASLTPYIYYQQALWIFVSQLSAHTANLMQHKKASVLINETESKNIFATTRVTLQCHVEMEDGGDSVLDEMESQLGETVAMLRQLPDFYLLKLQPVSGRFIAGFGQAYDIAFPELQLTHIGIK